MGSREQKEELTLTEKLPSPHQEAGAVHVCACVCTHVCMYVCL